MSIFRWFSRNKKKQEVQVAKRRTSPLRDAAVAAAFAEAGEHETARSLAVPVRQRRKILVIGHREGFSEQLSRYALDMAGRLDFELVALNVTSAPLALAPDEREAAVAAFKESAVQNSTRLRQQAASAGIVFTHLAEVADQDELVERLHAKDPGLRYVLTEPDPAVARRPRGRISIPVFGLGSFQKVLA